MKKNTRKTKRGDEPIGSLRRISDFLPPPHKLVPAEETVKVTIALDRLSLNFFKSWASKTGAKYQRMIREVLRGYAAHYGHR